MTTTTAPSCFTAFANNLPDFFHNPDEPNIDQKGNEIPLNIWTTTYMFKKCVLVIGEFTNLPTAWAAVGRKINDYMLPYLATLANVYSDYAPIGSMYTTAFIVVDLGELINDANYFWNGGFYKDMLTNRIFSAMGHILLVPINIVGVAVYLRAVELSEKIGRIQCFAWVPVIATYGALAEGGAVGVYTLLGFDALYRSYTSFHQRNENCTKYQAALKKEFNRDVTNLINHSLAEVKSANLRTLANLRGTCIKNDLDNTQANADIMAAISEILLRSAVLIGITSQPILFGLGLFATLAVGRSLYYNSTSAAPDISLLN